MGDVFIDNPVNTIPPHKKVPPTDSIPNIDSLEGSGNDSGDEYATLKRYQRHLEYINLQEEYIKDEQRYNSSFGLSTHLGTNGILGV